MSVDQVEILVTTRAKSESSDDGVSFEYTSNSKKIPVTRDGNIDLSECKDSVDLVFVLDSAPLKWKKPPHNKKEYKKIFHRDGKKCLVINDKGHFKEYSLSSDQTRITITSPGRDKTTYKYSLSFKADGARDFSHDPQIKNGGTRTIPS